MYPDQMVSSLISSLLINIKITVDHSLPLDYVYCYYHSL